MEAVRQLVMHLFPKLRTIWGNISYGSMDEAAWRRQLRVCSVDRFPMYFRLAAPEGSISNAEMNAVLSLAGDKDAFGERLLALAGQLRPDGTTRVRAFLELLEDYTSQEIPIEHIPSIVAALLDVGDELLRPEDEPRAIFDFGNETRIGRILWQLVRRLDEPNRFDVLKGAMSNGRAVSNIVCEIAVLGQEHGKYGEPNPDSEGARTVNAVHLQELEKVGLGRIRELAAQGGALLQARGSLDILYRWRDWAGEEEVKKWVQDITSRDAGLLPFLELFLRKSLVEYGTRVSTQTKFGLKSLSDFLEPSAIVNRVRGLPSHEELTENQRTAIEQFIQEYGGAQGEKAASA